MRAAAITSHLKRSGPRCYRLGPLPRARPRVVETQKHRSPQGLVSLGNDPFRAAGRSGRAGPRTLSLRHRRPTVANPNMWCAAALRTGSI